MWEQTETTYDYTSTDMDEKHQRLAAVQFIGSASKLLAMLKAEPNLAIKVTLGFRKHWVCDTKGIKKVLKKDIKEAKKFLKGKKNKYYD